MNTTTRKLREKINEACEELLRVKFGCELETEDGGILVTCTGSSSSRGTLCVDENGWRYYAYIIEEQWKLSPNMGKEEQDVKILGTPPTLEHLLRAIRDKSVGNTFSFTGRQLEVVVSKNALENERKRISGYDLTKSPLDQDEETTKALVELLSQNNS